MTDRTLGTSGLWLGTWIRAGGTATLIKSFFGRSPWLNGQQDNNNNKKKKKKKKKRKRRIIIRKRIGLF